MPTTLAPPGNSLAASNGLQAVLKWNTLERLTSMEAVWVVVFGERSEVMGKLRWVLGEYHRDITLICRGRLPPELGRCGVRASLDRSPAGDPGLNSAAVTPLWRPLGGPVGAAPAGPYDLPP